MRSFTSPAPLPRTWSTGLILLIVAIAASGCSMFMRSMEKPQATVRDVALSSAGLSGVSGELRLDVMNPNGFGVPLSAIDWQLDVGGARAITGSVQLSQTIPARGVAPVTTSLSVAVRDAIAVAGALASGARTYRLRARLTFSTRIGPLTVELDHAGELSGGTIGSLR